MEIVVLVKPVPEAETRLRPNPSGTELDPEGVKWVLAGYDESAVEQALLLKESVPGSRVRVISFGPAPRSEEVLRAALALGCDAAVWVEAPPGTPADPVSSAAVLAAALRRFPHDLVLAGKQAGDDESGLVAAAVGEFLGVADVGHATDLRWDPGRSRFTFRRAVEGGSERGEVPAPCVVGLQQAWNDPRSAKLPNILKSRRAPIERLALADLAGEGGAPGAPGSRTVGFRLPAPRAGARLIDYSSPEDAAAKLVKILKEEAKVFP